MINEFWIGKKGEDPLIEVQIDHTPQLGDIVYYLCDGSENNYEYLRSIDCDEMEGVVVKKWTSLSDKKIVWTVEC